MVVKKEAMGQFTLIGTGSFRVGGILIKSPGSDGPILAVDST